MQTCSLRAQETVLELLNASGCSLGVPYNPCTGQCYAGYQVSLFEDLWFQPYATVIYGQIYPILVFLTIASNIFVVLVLTKKQMRTATNTVLLYMAIADLFVAIVPFPFMMFYFTFGNHRRPERVAPWWCYMKHFMTTDVLPPVCHNVAIWLTVLLAAQRLIFVRYPMKAGTVCTVRNVNLATLAILILSFLGNLPKFVEVANQDVLNFRLLDTDNKTLIAEQHSCIYQYTAVVGAFGVDNFYQFYYWSRVILFVVIPSLLLIILSIFLVAAIQTAQKRRSRLLTDDRHHRDHTSMMLVVVVVIFVLVNLPQGLIMALFCVQNTFQTDFLEPRLSSMAVMVDNMLILATYPLNFAIYCSMSASFRETFKALFCRRVEIAYRRASLGTSLRVVVHHRNGHAAPAPRALDYSNLLAVQDPNADASESASSFLQGTKL